VLKLREHLPDAEHHADFLRLLWTLRQPRSCPVAVFFVPVQDGKAWHPRRCLMDIVALSAMADWVVVCITETVSLSHIIDELTILPNVLVMTPGQHNYGPGRRKFLCWQHWIQDLQISWNTDTVRSRIAGIQDLVHDRPYLFDVLLGGERPYRTWLHDWIRADTELSPLTLMTYYQDAKHAHQFMLEPEVKIDKWPDPMHTGALVQYAGQKMRLACVPPISIYQQSWFTVLAETSAHGAWNFYTEKVAKPLLANRLFLVLGGQHYLQGLRDAGFRTFAGIIDESYDLEPDDQRRARMVFEEMRRIARRDPRQIMEDTRFDREHNQAHARSIDWMADAVCRAIQIVESQTQIVT